MFLYRTILIFHYSIYVLNFSRLVLEVYGVLSVLFFYLTI
jgi:hypothetical protein